MYPGTHNIPQKYIAKYYQMGKGWMLNTSFAEKAENTATSTKGGPGMLSSPNL